MKYFAAFAALLVLLTVCACTAKPAADVTTDASVAGNSEETTSVSAAETSEAPEVFTALSDFLTEEQIQLYKKAAEIYPLFIGHSDGIDTLHLALQGASLGEQQLYLANYQMRDDIPEFYQINDLTYAFCRGAYQTMDDFRELCLSVFTDAYFDALNDTGLNIPTFIQINGYLYHKRHEPASLWADILRAFCIVRLGISAYAFVVRSKNHHKISRPRVSCSFARADFCPGEKKDAGHTPVFPSLLTKHGRKYAGRNLVGSCRLWYTTLLLPKAERLATIPKSFRIPIRWTADPIPRFAFM